MAFNPLGLGFMIPSAEEIAAAIVSEEALRRSEEQLRRSEEELQQRTIDLFEKIIEDKKANKSKLFVSTESEGKQPIYPHITLEEEVEAVKNKEIKCLFLNEDYGMPTCRLTRFQPKWVDETREEAKNPAYLRKIAEFDEMCKKEGSRVYVMGEGWVGDNIL